MKVLLAGLFLTGCSSQSYQTITAKEAKTMIEEREVIIIDVREENEYNQGHIQDAILIPLSSINKDNELLPDKDKTVLVYCRSGNRSAKAAKKLVDLGYKDIYDFGGILDWPYSTTK
ncbi:MAG: rhodanese-like domain-containing protein [Coprobacillus sp.]